VRYLVISDIHGNLEALDASLEAGRERGYDSVLVLGDLVGYGADPNPVVDRVRELAAAAVIRGNHDKVASGVEDGEGFNQTARSAVHWTFAELTPKNREWLASLPPGPVLIDDLVEICHGAPFDEDAYVFDELDALRAIEESRRPVCLFGHTHIPVAFVRTSETLEILGGGGGPEREFSVTFDPHFRYLINPGSVGQPRDGDPRAALALLDTSKRTIDLFRVAYPVEAAQAKVIHAGLPEILARRLGLGR
jgi:predicted phosphodiesterase